LAKCPMLFISATIGNAWFFKLIFKTNTNNTF
jgi:hypothetical protein